MLWIFLAQKFKYFENLSFAEKNWKLLRKIEHSWVLLRKIEHCWAFLRKTEFCWVLLRKVNNCWEKLSFQRNIENWWEKLSLLKIAEKIRVLLNFAEKNWVSWEIAEKSGYPWAWPGRSSRWCWARRPLRPLVFHKLLEACDHGLVISKCRRLPRLSHFLL